MKKINFLLAFAILYIILSYTIFAAYVFYYHNIIYDYHSMYQHLTKSFLSGHLYLLHHPPEALLKLADPYDPTQNLHLRWHDVSLFKGKYYVYFGPLPVLFFYIPYKLITNCYPPDVLSILFFTSLGFIANFFLLFKIRNKYFPFVPEYKFIFSIFILGFAGGKIFLLINPYVYEVAITSAFCLMSIAIYYLYECIENNYNYKDVFIFSLSLSLSVAGRPHFVLICLWLFPVILSLILNNSPKDQKLKRSLTLILPAVSIGSLLGLYNYLRFGSIFDFGHYWQLSLNNIKTLYQDIMRFDQIARNIYYSGYYYFIQPFEILLQSPFIKMRFHPGNIPIDNNYYVESITGIFPSVPILLFLLLLPKLLWINRSLSKFAVEDDLQEDTARKTAVYTKVHEDLSTVSTQQGASTVEFGKRSSNHEKKLSLFLLLLTLIPITIISFLIIMPAATYRYAIDFLPYLILLAIITFWLFEKCYPYSKYLRKLNMLFLLFGVISILIGILLRS